MSRVIDTLPTPSSPLKKRLIVTAISRTGTFSLYQALKILGYRPYHMYEVVCNGSTHMSILEEALKAKYQDVGKPYGKAEFDKWFANYDAIVEITQFFLEDLIEFYPDAQYLHVERDVDAWYRSVDNTAGSLFASCKKFPMRQISLLDNFVGSFCSLHMALETFWTDGKAWLDAEDVCKEKYLATNQKVQNMIPEKNLAVFRLEDGFGWEQICPYLKKPIPETPYPKGNAPKEFKKMAQDVLVPRIKRAMVLAATSVLVPIIAIGFWAYRIRK